MPNLIHCIYASAATTPFDDEALGVLLSRARRANAARGISGILVYTKGSFFQVLEGGESQVGTLVDLIASDLRHCEVTEIIREPIHRRAFGDWTMGCAHLSAEQLESIEGCNDFFHGGSCLTHLDQGRARKLLQSFSAGRWRSTLQGADSQSSAA